MGRRILLSRSPAAPPVGPAVAAGYELVTLPADAAGGAELERLARSGTVAGVLDLDLAAVAGHLSGGVADAGPDRLTGAGLAGVPQVVGLGGLDGVGFPGVVPPSYRGRAAVVLPSGLTLIRTSPAECDRVGLDIAQKACAARGPTAVLIPAGGLSGWGTPGGPLHDPAADAALVESLRNWVAGVELVESAHPAHAPEYASDAWRVLVRLLTG